MGIPACADLSDARLERGARVCAAVVVAAVLVFGAWQLVMPAGFDSVRGLNPQAVAAWRAWWRLDPRPAPAVSLGVYRAVFRGSIVIAWVAYAGLTWSVMRGARLGRRWTWPLAVPLILALAVVVPASLSTDVFAYVGYARLAVVHGLNPHLHTQAELVRLGDPTTPYLRWPIPSPYGPLWTLLSMGVVYAVGGAVGGGGSSAAASVLGPVIAFKIIAGLGLLAAAAAARAIVSRQGPAVGTDPRRGSTVFSVLTLNPLLLIEGPGNGHNDLVMVALLLAGVAALGGGRARAAAALVGVGAAVKLLPLLAVPWLAIVAARAAAPRVIARAGAVAVTTALALLPVVAAYAPLWAGPATLGGVVARWQKGGTADGAGVGRPQALDVPQASDAPRAAGYPGSESEGRRGSTTIGPAAVSPAALRAGLSSTLRRILWLSPAFLIYLWATLAMGLGWGDAASRLVTVWAYVALAVLCFAAGLWCSWYLAWVWPAVVLRFTRPHKALLGFVLPFSLLLMLAYATPAG